MAALKAGRETVFDIRDMSVYYGTNHALGWTSLKIYRKLELHGRTEAMLWAARQGLLPGEVH